jgi:hypothetical protein
MKSVEQQINGFANYHKVVSVAKKAAMVFIITLVAATANAEKFYQDDDISCFVPNYRLPLQFVEVCKDDQRTIAEIKANQDKVPNPPPKGWMTVTIFVDQGDGSLQFIGESCMEVNYVKWLHGCKEGNGCH